MSLEDGRRQGSNSQLSLEGSGRSRRKRRKGRITQISAEIYCCGHKVRGDCRLMHGGAWYMYRHGKPTHSEALTAASVGADGSPD